MRTINTEEHQSNIEITTNKDTDTLYVSWDEFALPQEIEEGVIQYTVSLFKNSALVNTKFVESNLEAYFEGIDLDGNNKFSSRIEGNIYANEETIDCGQQELTVTVINGVSLMVTNVNASFSDNGDLCVSWDPTDLDSVNYSLKLIGQFINDDGESISDKKEKLFQKIENNLVTLTLAEIGIAAGVPDEGDCGQGLEYEIYITPHYKETGERGSDVVIDGTESDVFILHTSEEAFQELYNPEFNLHSLKAGDPVNISTGTFSYNNVDLKIGNGNLGLKFQVFYHSQYNKHSMFYDYRKKEEPENHPDLVLGTAWSHNYMISLAYKNQKVTIYFPNNGSMLFKQKNKKSKELKVKGRYNGDKLYYIHKNDETQSRYRYVKKDQTEYIFNNDGLLLEIISPIKNKITLIYNEDNLLQLVNAENLPYQLKFTYSNKKITEVTGVSYNVEQEIKYAYRGDNLVSYTDILGNSRKFDYYSDAKSALMMTAEDQNGTIFVYNEYAPTIDHYPINKSGYQVVFQQNADEYARAPKDKKNGLTFSYDETHGNLWPWNWSKRATFISTVARLWKYEVEGIEISGRTKTVSTANKSGALEEERITVSDSEKTNNYSYDGFNNCIHEYGDTINETYRMYDSEQNLLYETEDQIPSGIKPKNFINAYKYDSNNQLTSHTDELGNTTEYEYKNGNLITKRYPLNRSEKYSYLDSPVKGLVKEYTDQLGNITQYEYSTSSIIENPKTINDPNVYKILTQRGRTELTYEDNKCPWLPTMVIVFDGNNKKPLKTTYYEYNNMGVKTAESVAYKNQPSDQAFKTQYGLNNLNQITSLTDAESNITKFSYSPNMQRTEIKYPAVNGVAIEQKTFYDANNNTILEIVGDGITQYTYNSLNQLTKKIDQNGNTYKYVYSRMDNYQTTIVIYPEVEAGIEVNTTLIADRFNRPTKVTTRMGQEIYFKYDVNNGQLTVTTEYLKKNNIDIESTVVQTQDQLGRCIKSQDQDGNITTYKYSTQKSGNEYVSITTETNPLGIKSISKTNTNEAITYRKTGNAEFSYEYDALNRIVETTQKLDDTKSLASSYKYEYELGSKTMQTILFQNDEKISTSSYNGLGQLVLEQNEQNATRRSFNARGQLEKYTMLSTDLTLSPDSHQITYGYDNTALNNLITFADGSYISKKFDHNGNNIETKQYSNNSTEISSETRDFDVWDRVKSITKTQAENSISNIIGYEYNDDNMLTKLVYPSSTEIVSVSYEYDNLQRLKSVTDWKNRVTTYEYTPTGNVKNTVFSNGVICINSYDAAQNLKMIKTVKNGTLISLYKATKINDNGYPLEVTQLHTLRPKEVDKENVFGYNLTNQLETIDDGTKIKYDVNGNPATLPKVDGTISYNDMNLITRYGDDEYKYDAFGLRSQSRINGVTKNYLVSSNDYSAPYLSILDPLMGPELMQASSMPPISVSSPLDLLLQTSDEDDNLQKRFIYGNGLIAEESESGDYRIYHYDAQGSTVALTDENGIVTDKYAYSPYGEVLAHEGNNDTGFLYNGKVGVYTDSNGLSNMRSRSYRPDLMRFVQQDFLLGDETNPMSLNRYAFAGGNPIEFADPLGLERENYQNSDSDSAGSSWWQWLLIGAAGAFILGLAIWKYKRYYRRAQLIRGRIRTLDVKIQYYIHTGDLNSALFFNRHRNRNMKILDSYQTKKKIWTVLGSFGFTIFSGGISFFISELTKE